MEKVRTIVPIVADLADDYAESVAVEAIERACDHRGMKIVGAPQLVWSGTWQDAMLQSGESFDAIRGLNIDASFSVQMYEAFAA